LKARQNAAVSSGGLFIHSSNQRRIFRFAGDSVRVETVRAGAFLLVVARAVAALLMV
jgi:hypothetical protein